MRTAKDIKKEIENIKNQMHDSWLALDKVPKLLDELILQKDEQENKKIDFFVNQEIKTKSGEKVIINAILYGEEFPIIGTIYCEKYIRHYSQRWTKKGVHVRNGMYSYDNGLDLDII